MWFGGNLDYIVDCTGMVFILLVKQFIQLLLQLVRLKVVVAAIVSAPIADVFNTVTAVTWHWDWNRGI